MVAVSSCAGTVRRAGNTLARHERRVQYGHPGIHHRGSLTLLSVTSPGPYDTTISGTPTTPGSFTFTIQVMDSASNTATREFTIVVH
ncbi:MAG: putative Ig domain-containing protein [Planctomycetota bacterium]